MLMSVMTMILMMIVIVNDLVTFEPQGDGGLGTSVAGEDRLYSVSFHNTVRIGYCVTLLAFPPGL